MHNQDIKNKIKEANQLLDDAYNELLKSKDDVVPFMACSAARRSISQYLTAYLMKQEREFDSNASIDELLEQCKDIDEKFQKIKIGPMNCSSSSRDSRFCTDVKKVDSCVQIAEATKNLVVSEPWPLSKRVK